MARKLLHGAREAADGVAGAARHLAWYLSYCLDGSATRPTRSPGEPSADDAGRRRVS